MFFTRPTNGRPGDPVKAASCRCARPWADHDSCVRCGRFWWWVVEATWELHGQPKPEPHQGVPAVMDVAERRLEQRLNGGELVAA